MTEDLGAEVFSNLTALIHLAECSGNLRELLVEQEEDGALNGVRKHQIVNLSGVELAVAVDAPDALLQVHRVPRQIEVKEHASVLEVDTFAARCGADEHPWAIRSFETLLRSCLRSVVTALEHRDPLTGICPVNLRSQHLDTAEICSKYDHPLLRVLSPQHAQCAYKLLHLRFSLWRILRQQFLDTPPQKTKTTIPALKAADFAVLSAMPDHLAVSALAEALADIVAAQRHANERLALLGVIVCAVPRPKTRLARELVAYVERTCVDAAGRTLKFSTEISRSVVVQEAQKMGQTILQYQGDHPVADEYRTLAKEFEDRLTVLRQTPPILLTEEVIHA